MAPANPPLIRRKRPWALTFFGLLAIGGLVSMPIVAGKPGDVEMPDLVRFLGHFHPVVLHLPIGVFILILLQELGAIFFRRGKQSGEGTLFPMFLGAASAVVAVIAGFLLYHGHGTEYCGNDLAERHLWGGLVFAVAAVFTFIVKAWTFALAANPAWYRTLLFGSVGVMGFASHDGASITHGSDYLTRYAPEPIRKMLGLPPVKSTSSTPADVADAAVYADIIAPIFERRCVQCHKEGKAKGKLRMDTYEMLVKGGKEGPAIEPGSAAKSNIIVRIELPADDDEHMPPEGKPDIEDAELVVLKWWLDSGASAATKLADSEVPTGIRTALAKLPATSPASHTEGVVQPEPTKTAGPDDALKATVAELAKEFPGALSFESPDSPRVTFSAVSLNGKLDDQSFGKLAPVLPHLSTLDLSATLITDQSVAALETATQLRMLRLSETPVTDAAIDSLLKLPALESINFHGTKITDAGAQKLAAMTGLKHLYLWQTSVTPEVVKTLREKLPECEIITGS